MINVSSMLIPNLNLLKKDGRYFLKSEKGILKSDYLCFEFDIGDIEISIGDTISVKFHMGNDDFNRFDEKILNSNIKPFSKYNNFTVECKTGEYNIILSNFINRRNTIGPNDIYILGGANNVKLVKDNQNTFNSNDMIKVWDILESKCICQPFFQKLDVGSEFPIYLKSLIPKNFNIPLEFLENYDEEYMLKEKESFAQLLNHKTFLFYETTYQNKFPSVINDIKNLLSFYTLNTSICMKIIEGINDEKLEIIIYNAQNPNSEQNSIFSNSQDNFLNFINNSYTYYRNEINLKNFNVDLLIYYYVRIKKEGNLQMKTVLCSEFIEVLKNIVMYPERDEKNELYKRVNAKITSLNMDASNLLKFLQPEIYEILFDIKKRANKKSEFNSQKIHTLWLKLTETYVLSIITFYRNRIIHTGRYSMQNSDIDSFIEYWKDRFTQGLTNFPNDILDFVVDNIKDEFHDNVIFNIKNQSMFLEYFCEIVLLALLHVDCKLKKNYNLLNIDISEDLNSNSKNLINNFLKS